MPSTTFVVACVLAVAVLVLLVLRSRNKTAQAEAPRFEPPRELAKRPPKKEPAKEQAKEVAPPSDRAPSSPPPESTPLLVTPPPAAFPKPDDEEIEKTTLDAVPPSTEEIAADHILSTEARAGQKQKLEAPPTPTSPPPLPRHGRPPMRSYSSISDESVADEVRASAPAPEPKPKAAPTSISESKVGAAQKLPPLPASEPRVPAARVPASEPRIGATAKPKLPISEPKIAATPKLPTSEPKVPAARPASEPRVAATKSLPTSEARVPAAKPEPKLADTKGATDEHDFSALNDAPAAKQAAAATAAATVAKFVPPPNPATADLEKDDPRHAAARRLARISVSEIKLYHEDEVKAGREAKDLWKRLQQDIALARQTFDGRVVTEVRDRFDYLLDEIVRQLAEGDPAKLGPEAPKLKGGEATAEAAPAATPTPAAEASAAVAAPSSGEIIAPEAPTRTARTTLEPEEPKAEAKAEAPKPRPVEAKPAPAVKPAEAKPAEAAGKPTGVAARGLPPNPETADLEKDDPRHAAARRLARLSVSEIKLYHEDEVQAGRAAKDLWKRMITDIGLAMQTYDKRVDKEVRDRFDYLYDEILRQLAEGDVSKLGADAPKPKKAEPEPVAVQAPKPAASEPKLAAAASPAARYAPPSNPATAELEKNDPRHAAARRLARLSVSEIKLYHEDEVKAGREAKDLWKRLITDIGLATQTFEKRVDKEVRDRFDYLYDEILRQLAEGDTAKLGPDAPKPKADA